MAMAQNIGCVGLAYVCAPQVSARIPVLFANAFLAGQSDCVSLNRLRSLSPVLLGLHTLWARYISARLTTIITPSPLLLNVFLNLDEAFCDAIEFGLCSL